MKTDSENKSNILNSKKIHKNPLDLAIDLYNNGREEQIPKRMFNKIYPFTTENINGYISLLNLKDKKFLTVGSSGDQVINSAVLGCVDQTVVDLCPFTKYAYYLKAAGIESLDYYDFLEAFYPGKMFNDRNKLNKILDKLYDIDQDSFNFWEKLYDNFKVTSVEHCMYSKDTNDIGTTRMINPYLQDKKMYEMTSSILPEINPTFIRENLEEYKTLEQYDCIYLSNVPDYLKEENNITMIKNLSVNLTENGIIAFYNYNNGNHEQLLQNIETQQIPIPNVKIKNAKYKDSVHIYHK